VSTIGALTATERVSTESSRRIRYLYLTTAYACIELFAAPEVEAAWELRSDLPDLSVGALVGHVCRGILRVESLLDADNGSSKSLTSAAEYYVPFARSSSAADERNRVARDLAMDASRAGSATLLATVRDCLARVTSRLMVEPIERRVEVPRSSTVESVCLLLDEYLKVRVVEQMVHYDDMARSLPEASSTAVDVEACKVAIDVLVGSATLRHGPRAVLRALARHEIDDIQALRVL
jgi:hypothetical protein